MRELRITIHLTQDERTDRLKARLDAGENAWAEFEGNRGDLIAQSLGDSVYSEVRHFALNEKMPTISPDVAATPDHPYLRIDDTVCAHEGCGRPKGEHRDETAVSRRS